MELNDGIWVALGFKADTLKLKEFVSAIGDLDMRTVAATLGLGTLYDATYKIMNLADQTAMSMFSFSQTTGISSQKMEQLSTLTKQFGGSASDASTSLKNLQNAMFQAQLHGGGMAFVLTGIDPFKDKDPFVVLEKVATFLKSSRFNDDAKRMVVAQLGISESMIPMLKNIDKLKKAMGEQLTPLQSATDALLTQSMAASKLDSDWRVLVTDIGGAIAPGIQKLAEVLDHLTVAIAKSPELTKSVAALATAIGVIVAALTALGIYMAIGALIAWVAALAPVELAFLAIATAIGLVIANLDKLPHFAENPFSTMGAIAASPSSVALGQLAGNNPVVNNTIDVVVHAAEAGVKDLGAHIARL